MRLSSCALFNTLALLLLQVDFSSFCFVQAAIHSRRTNNNNQHQSFFHSSRAKASRTIMGNTSNNNDNNNSNNNNHQDTAVLSELKETIQNQALEIKRLRKQLATTTAGAVSSSGGGGGHHAAPTSDSAEGYLNKTFLQVARHRVGWLSLFLLSLSFTALIVNGFEHTLARQIELAFFMPLLAGHGGNTGGQTVGTVLSAISSGGVDPLKDAPRVILKEACSGLTVGCFLGALVGCIAYYAMGISMHVSTVIFCTLPLVSVIASTLGSSIPFVCVSLGLDPSVIAAPAMTSFVDVSGLLAYFLIANQVFNWFGLEL